MTHQEAFEWFARESPKLQAYGVDSAMGRAICAWAALFKQADMTAIGLKRLCEDVEDAYPDGTDHTHDGRALVLAWEEE